MLWIGKAWNIEDIHHVRGTVMNGRDGGCSKQTRGCKSATPYVTPQPVTFYAIHMTRLVAE
jgi:hypothetical protein